MLARVRIVIRSFMAETEREMIWIGVDAHKRVHQGRRVRSDWGGCPEADHQYCSRGRLLCKLGYSLHVNAKKIEAISSHPDRAAYLMTPESRHI